MMPVTPEKSYSCPDSPILSHSHDTVNVSSSPVTLSASEGITFAFLEQSKKFLHDISARIPRFFSMLTAIVGIHIVLRGLFSTYRHPANLIQNYVKYLIIIPDTSISWGVALMILSGALLYRKRIGWLVLLTIFILTFLNDIELLRTDITNQNSSHFPIVIPHQTTHSTLWSSQRIIECNLGILLAFIILLLIATPVFSTKVRRGNIPLALTVLISGIIIVSAAGAEIFHHSFSALSSTSLFTTNFKHNLGLPADPAVLNSILAGKIYKVLGIATAIVYMVSLVVLLRSQKSLNAMTPSDETVVRRLNDIFGNNDSLSYYATRRDKAIIWAPNALSAITYRVEIGVCIASGDPIGKEQSWSLAIDEWLKLCNNFGWTPAVEGASKSGAMYYGHAGLKSWLLGDEAIIYTDKFSISGSNNKSLRQAVNRARRSGVKIRIRRQHELSPTEIRTIHKYINDWRIGGTERGFSMALGRFGDPLDPNVLVVEAYQDTHQGEKPLGILCFVPWGQSGISLDIMRRSKDSPNGTVEFMVSELALNYSKYNITRISLNFAMLRRVFADGTDIGIGPILKIWYKILLFCSRFWQLESLYNSSSKYHPEWYPRYVCYPTTRSMPKVGVAIALAEGFLSFPKIVKKWGKDNARSYTGLYPTVPPAALQQDFLTGPEFDHYTKLTPRRPEQVAVRISKVEHLQNLGIDPYPPACPPSHAINLARQEPIGTPLSIAGRITYIRSFGGVLFASISDWTGSLQILIEQSQATKLFKQSVDLGDLVRVTGTMGYSRKGELSVLCHQWFIQGKSLHPLPDKRHGLTDPEAKIRLRHMDIATSATARSTLMARSTIITSLRATLDAQGYIEVETPILQSVHGGANATPFTTHINAYNLDLYLRIAPELYLKRLIVGGMNKVYELGRQFRNEGTDTTHNPEFTSVEAYAAYGDYHTMSDLARIMIQQAASKVHGKEIFLHKNADDSYTYVDISGQWPKITVLDALATTIGTNISIHTPLEELQHICLSYNINYLPQHDAGQLIMKLYENLIEPTTYKPTFYYDFPLSTCPLTREHRFQPGMAERWDLVAMGMELATAYTELTDPLEQRRRLTLQSLLAAAGDAEAMQLDEDFLTALEFAMPPTGGLGIGVDRLVMLITGKTIRETLLFPLAKTINP